MGCPGDHWHRSTWPGGNQHCTEHWCHTSGLCRGLCSARSGKLCPRDNHHCAGTHLWVSNLKNQDVTEGKSLPLTLKALLVRVSSPLGRTLADSTVNFDKTLRFLTTWRGWNPARVLAIVFYACLFILALIVKAAFSYFYWKEGIC